MKLSLKQLPKAVVILIALSVVVSWWTGFGRNHSLILPFVIGLPGTTPLLADVLNGEVWRLITPILLHFGALHLIFNCITMFMIGSPIEFIKGWKTIVGLTIVCGILSNLLQLYMTQSVAFGGLSGVLYGFFGYLWMQSVFNPTLGIKLPAQFLIIMLGWFIACWLEVIPNVANWAHTGGFVAGLVIGIAHAKYDVYRVAKSVRDLPR